MAKYLDYEGLERYTDYVKGKLDGKAAASHNHSATNITSGTLAVARGGTGLTSSPSMLTNLGSTSAASVLAASPRPGVTGTLPIANGGTGATTAAKARTALGITLANLGAAASSHSHSASDVTSGTFPTARIADGAVTAAKLASDVGIVAVSAAEPTDSNVLFWVEISS